MARSLTMVGTGGGGRSLRDKRAAGAARTRPAHGFLPPLFASAVSRFICHSDLYEMDLHIDINTELFPLQVRVAGDMGREVLSGS